MPFAFSRSMRHGVRLTIGLAVGVGILALLFHGTDIHSFCKALREVHPGWLLLALLPIIISFFTRVQRWTYIVRATHPDALYGDLFAATQLGFMGNSILPARLGEIIRALALRRLSNVPFSQGVAFVALDRITDIAGLMATMLIAAPAFHPSSDIVLPTTSMGLGSDVTVPASLLRTSALAFLILLTGILVVLAGLYANQKLVLHLCSGMAGLFSRRLAIFVETQLKYFADGLHIFKSASAITMSLLWSLITWACFIASTAMFLQAFGITAPWFASFVIQAAIAVGISVPGTPGFIGQFQIPIVASITVLSPSTPHAHALALALALHLINTALVVASGIICLYWKGFQWRELTRRADNTGIGNPDSCP